MKTNSKAKTFRKSATYIAANLMFRIPILIMETAAQILTAQLARRLNVCFKLFVS